MLRKFASFCAKGFTNALSFTGYHPRDPKLVEFFGGGEETASGVNVTPQSAMTFSAVYNAIEIISSAMALMPCQITRYDPKTRQRDIAYDHWLYPLLFEAPNPEQTAFEFKQQMQADALGWGWGVAEKQYNLRGQVVNVWRIEPWAITESRNYTTDRLEYTYTDPVTGRNRDIPAENLFIIRCMHSKSPIRLARESIGVALAAQNFGASFFGKGARTSGALSHPDRLSPDAKSNIREDLMLWQGGLKNALYPLILDEGLTYTPFTIPPNEAQFLETRQFQVVEIARWFNIPPHMLKELGRATWKNIEYGQIEFRTVTMQPWVTRWQQSLNRSMLNRNDRGVYQFFFDMDALVYGDMKTRQDANQVKFRNGVLTLDEWMVEEGYNPVGGEIGGMRFVEVNMQTIENAIAQQKLSEKMLENLDKGLDSNGNSTDPASNDDESNDGSTSDKKSGSKAGKKPANGNGRFSLNGSH